MSNLLIIYKLLKAEGYTDEGIFGLMGNWRAESNFNPNNLQNSYQNKLGHTDESYTKAVDNGTYTRFATDSAGYGLAQWTSSGRKAGLLEFAKSRGTSIGNLEMQVAFAIHELNTGYKSTRNVLKAATSIKEASDYVCKKYERPANQSESALARRAGYGEEVKAEILKELGNNESEGDSKMSIRNKVLAICVQELGVGEPTGDDKYIDWFNKNVLKTWSFAMNVAWCSIFVTYAGVHAGLTGNEMPLTASCDSGMNWFKNRKQWKDGAAYGGTYIPKRGDIVYYSSTKNQNDSTHVGWVESCDGNLLVAIEGNYSNMVKRRTIYLSNDYILGYGIVNFPDESGKVTTTNPLRGTGVGTGIALTSMNVRTGPGTSYGVCGSVQKGKPVEVLAVTDNEWLKIVWDIAENGFAYVSDTKPYFDITWTEESYKDKSTNFAVGTIVQFTGTTHYTSANAAKGKVCKSGKAKITQFADGAKHPYHLIATNDSKGDVYGWVNATDVSPLSQEGYVSWVGKVDNCSVLNVRKGAGTEYGKLQAWPQLSKGNVVEVIGEVRDSNGKLWYYVNIRGNKGYVHSAYITTNI